jgi:DNA-binding NtrC family response regulator
MVVDEDESERKFIADLLETAGHRVTQASNGKQALALLVNDPPDVLLTDIVMSEKDGLELIQDVRRHHSKTIIIAMSGTVRADGYPSITRLLGAKYILKKPLSVDQLLRTLRDAPATDD